MIMPPRDTKSHEQNGSSRCPILCKYSGVVEHGQVLICWDEPIAYGEDEIFQTKV